MGEWSLHNGKLITSKTQNSNVPELYADEAYSELPAL